MKYFAYIVSAVVLAALVTGFVVVGSPQNKRVQRFDERRVQDLSNIQWEIVNHWQRKNALPENLDALKDDLSGYRMPRDPETAAPYEYQKTADRSFKLCANFKEASASDEGSYAGKYAPVEAPLREGNWEHGAGYVCFERTIDPDLYKPVR